MFFFSLKKERKPLLIFKFLAIIGVKRLDWWPIYGLLPNC